MSTVPTGSSDRDMLSGRETFRVAGIGTDNSLRKGHRKESSF